MEFTFIPGKRTGRNLLIDGYLFTKNKTTSFNYFRCADSKCKSTLSMDSTMSVIVNQPGGHNHPRPTEDINKEKFRRKVLVDVQNNPTAKLRNIYNNEVQITDTEEVIPPPFDQIRKGLHNLRQKSLPPVPKKIEDVKIPDNWKNTSSGNRFLLAEEKGILLFCTDDGLKFLANSNLQ